MDGRTRVDWVGSIRSLGPVWGLPAGVMAVGLLVDIHARTIMWTIALAWMGTACILNARRCGRTLCRFTGPFYLALIIPVILLGSGISSFGAYAWLTLAAVIIFGTMVIWWGTERAWGRFS